MPELAEAMQQLDGERFPKLIAYVNNPISQRVPDEQSRGAHQLGVSLSGEGAVQMAATKDAGSVRGLNTRRRLEQLETTKR